MTIGGPVRACNCACHGSPLGDACYDVMECCSNGGMYNPSLADAEAVQQQAAKGAANDEIMTKWQEELGPREAQ